MKFPLATSTWDAKELSAITSVVESGMCTMGKNVAQFESDFASYIGSEYAVMVNSGSSANLIMTAALFYTKTNVLKPGDEVIVPAVSWPTTYYPLHQYGLKLKFVDIDVATLNYDLSKLESAITDKTRLLMVVNLLGNPNDFDAIANLVKDRNIILIEDNCESLGATFRDKFAGTFGMMGSYSTFFSHHMSTMEGGLVVTDNEELYHILLCLRAHGWTRNLPKVNQVSGVKSDDPFEESFKFILPGYNVRPLEVEGAIGIEQLKKLPDFMCHRRSNAKLFKSYFANNPYFSIQEEIGSSSWFGFAMILNENSPVNRSEFAKRLLSAGVECRPIVAGNFAKNPVMRYMNYDITSSLDGADCIDRNGLFIGNHQYDLTNELGYFHDLVCSIFK
jgi:Predicted pyridoxal phosphate-dependent enzyme apparently involved in regulation of cell wall biogenesis